MGGEATKHNLAFCVVVDDGEKGTYDSVLNKKYFIQAVNFCGPIKGYCGPLRASICPHP